MRLETTDQRLQTKEMKLNKKRLFIVVAFCLQSLVSSLQSGNALAAEKSWNAAGDQVDWFDDANWNPAVAPTASDDTMVNLTDASVMVGQNFGVKSLTIGGKRESTVSVKNFITGDVEPGSPSDLAVFNRKDGHLVLKGSAGKITLRGAYKDSEEIIPDEPSFMLYVS